MKKKRNRHIFKQTTDTMGQTFTPITLASLGIEEPAPLQLSAEQDMLLDAWLEVEQEKICVQFLQEMTVIKNPAKHKQLLEEHQALLRAAEARLEKRYA